MEKVEGRSGQPWSTEESLERRRRGRLDPQPKGRPPQQQIQQGAQPPPMSQALPLPLEQGVRNWQPEHGPEGGAVGKRRGSGRS